MPKNNENQNYISDIKDDDLGPLTILLLPKELKPLESYSKNSVSPIYEQFEDDILERYKREFGYVGVQQSIGIHTLSEPFKVFGYLGGLSSALKKELKEKKRFAFFMWLRLGELYLDWYLKSNPNIQRLYKVKKALSNIGVKTRGKNYYLKTRYLLAGNALKFHVKNPHNLANYLVLDFDSSQIIPGRLKEIILYLGVPIGNAHSGEVFYAFKKRVINLITRKEFRGGRYLSLDAETNLKEKKDYKITLGLSVLY